MGSHPCYARDMNDDLTELGDFTATRRMIPIQLHDLLEARARHLEDEQRRERVLPWEYILPQWIRPKLARGKTA